MIGAISSKGKTFFAINKGKNNSLSFSLFMLNLIQERDSLDPDWRKTTTIILDNALIIVRKPPRHTSRRSDC